MIFRRRQTTQRQQQFTSVTGSALACDSTQNANPASVSRARQQFFGIDGNSSRCTPFDSSSSVFDCDVEEAIICDDLDHPTPTLFITAVPEVEGPLRSDVGSESPNGPDAEAPDSLSSPCSRPRNELRPVYSEMRCFSLAVARAA